MFGEGQVPDLQLLAQTKVWNTNSKSLRGGGKLEKDIGGFDVPVNCRKNERKSVSEINNNDK